MAEPLREFTRFIRLSVCNVPVAVNKKNYMYSDNLFEHLETDSLW